MKPIDARLVAEQLDKGKDLQRAGNLGLARSHYERAVKLDPDNAAAWHLLATTALQEGNYLLAAKHLRRCLDLNPRYSEAQHDLGVALRESGRIDEAIAAFRAALENRPHYAEALFNLATAVEAQGDWAQAEQAYRQGLAWQPSNVDILVRLGNLLGRQGRIHEALPMLESACRLAPERAVAWGNLARVLSDLGRYADAIQCARAATARDPRRAVWWRILGVAQNRQRDGEGAAIALRKAIELAPDDPIARFELGLALRDAGSIDEAREVFSHGQVERLRWGAALSLPACYRDDAEIEAERARFAAGLSQLESQLTLHTPAQIDDAYRAVIGIAPFHLHYQPRDNTHLQCRFGDLVTTVMSKAAPELVKPCAWTRGARGARLRVGFVSSHLMYHTVSRYFGSLLTGLDPRRFDVHVWYCGDRRDDSTDRIAAAVGQFIHTRAEARDLAPLIRAAQMDVLVYPEIGMDPHHQALAALRLAPVQCLLYGHPATSGLENVDYFLSGEMLEPTDGAAHYRERLVRLPGLGARPDRPPVPGDGRWIEAYMSEAPVLLCLQPAIKLEPRFDHVVAAVVAATGARIAFFDRNPPLTRRFRARIESVFEAYGLDADRHLAFMPAQPHADYLAGIARAPLVLDSFWFSGGATSLDAFHVGTPVLALEGSMARGRQTSAMLRMMGLEGLIAHSPEQYIAQATTLLGDRDQLARLQERIKSSAHILFDDESALRAFENFLEKVTS
ncbi:MAG TPA: tetratricopeptide repeat protein [Rhodanobacteraceae bacterium]|nr:tetratricopeptide repeat protein [Rhodanobacteraceae bacterium]